MKVNVIGDLHGISLENQFVDNVQIHAKFNTGFDFSKLEKSDVLVIAGDLGYQERGYRSVLKEAEKWKGIAYDELVCIKGNHDFYAPVVQRDIIFNNDDLNPLLDRWNFVKKIGNVYFVCTPLWSEIIDNKDDCYWGMNDFNYIPGFNIEMYNKAFYNNVKFLRNTIEDIINKDDGDIVVVTHHVPTKKLLDKKFEFSTLNEAFVVMHRNIDLSYIMKNASKRIKMWIHGHSHSYLKKTINGITFVRNPIGYGRAGINECDFKYDCVFEV